MGDEPTNGELARRLDAGFDDLKEDMRTLAGRLDTKVDATYLQLQQQAQDERTAGLAMRLAAVEEAREREAQQRQQEQREAESKRAQEQREMENRRAGDKRLMLTALVAPLLLLLLQVYLASKGST